MDTCTKEQATAILENYTDADSFINGLVSINVMSQWDTFPVNDHNYYIYVKDNKLLWIPWDFDTAFGTAGLGACRRKS